MFLAARPSPADIEAFIAKSASDGFSYTAIGSTAGDAPAGYVVDHNREFLGTGNEIFERAKQALREWKMFDLGWVELHRSDTPIEVGRNVAVFVSHLGFFSLNAARIVYVIDEPDRFGFAYGTLADHVESGEERFSVERDPATGDVWYDLLAFSRPNHLLAKLGYPLTRHFQRRFARDSKTAMLCTTR
ncbi:MAG: DUF1990 domain-containing protein [Pyrinomonadaceae bacterium]|nr:DUF1990 domain-containing protein [Pyrinomonadaceae bacterium]